MYAYNVCIYDIIIAAAATTDKINYVIYVTIAIIIFALMGMVFVIYKQFDKIKNCISKRKFLNFHRHYLIFILFFLNKC